MKKRVHLAELIAITFLIFIGISELTAQNLPNPSGFVNDFARVLSSGDAQKLTTLVSAVQDKTGAEIAIVTVESIAPYTTIDEYAIELANKWGVGRKGHDDGVLFILAMKERRVKIEVGYGLEGAIPDSAAGRILDEAVLPFFRGGDFSAGMVKGTEAIANLIAKKNGIDPSVFNMLAQVPRALDPDALLVQVALARTELQKAQAGLKQDPWETDAEFASRKNNILDSDHSAAVAYRRAIVAVEAATFEVPADMVRLQVSPFDRDAKAWTLKVESLDAAVPFRGSVQYGISEAKDISSAYYTFAEAVQRGTLAVVIEYRMSSLPNAEWRITRLNLRIVDTAVNAVLARLLLDGAWIFNEGKWKAHEQGKKALAMALYEITGHREKSLLDSGMKDTMDWENYTLRQLNLLQSNIPEDASCIILNGPKVDFSKGEVDKVLAYLENGGRLLVLMDFQSGPTPNLNGLLASYGVQFDFGVVVEMNKNYNTGNPFQVVPAFGIHEIVVPLRRLNIPAILQFAQGIRVLDVKRHTVEIESLLQTSKDSFLRTDLNNNSREISGTDKEGPITIGAAVKEVLDYQTNKETRIVVIGSGTVFEPVSTFGQVPGNIGLFMNSIAWLQDRPGSISVRSNSKVKITVASDCTWPPMEFLTETKEIVGFDIDLMKAIADAAGFDVEIKNTAWDGIFTGLANNSYDAVISSVTITEERKGTMDFSDPYINAGQVLILKSSTGNVFSLGDLKGKSIGAQSGTIGAIAVEKVKDVTLKSYDELGVAVEDLVKGNIAGVVADLPIAADFVLHNTYYMGKLKIVGKPLNEEYYGIAVKKGNDKVLDLINEGLKKVRESGRLKIIEEKWLRSGAAPEGMVWGEGGSFKRLKAGFIYVGPVGNYGWSNAHDVGRKYAMSKLAWLETVFVESVPEGDSIRIIDRLVNEEKCDVVLTTSFGYMDDTVKAAEKYKDKLFFHCSGFKRAPNLGNYYAELYQMYYLNGLMAGAMTKSNKVGYVGAFPISEMVRYINAFALGVKESNPKAKVHIRWIFSWYDPAKAREAAESLVSEGVDAIAFTEDSPSVIEVGQEHTTRDKPVYTFSHYSPMQKFGKDSVISGQLVDWGVMYEKMFTDIYSGRVKDLSYYDLWWLAAEGAAILGGEFGQAVNVKYVEALKGKKIKSTDLGELNAYDYSMKRYEQIKAKQFEPFTGPIKDQKGVVRIKWGEKADPAHLLSIDYLLENVIGDIPR